MTTLDTSDAVIDALGGPTEMGRKLGVKQNTVSTWKAAFRGVIPAEYFLIINAELARLTPPRKASPAVFRIAEPERVAS